MERWAEIAGYEGWYQVSDKGSVKRVKGTPHYLKPGYNNQGRLQVTLCRGGVMQRFQIHRLVLETFSGPCPEGKECRHRDGNETHNWLENLAWGTHTENMQDKTAHGTQLIGEKHPKAKLTEQDVKEIRAAQGTNRELAEVYGVSNVAIHFIRIRKTWKHVP